MAQAVVPVLERIELVQHDLIWDYPFYASIILNQEFVRKEKKDTICGTMETDFERIYYCDEFIAGHDRDELLFAFVHEANHIALGHNFRRGNREPRKWNAACDFAINDIQVRFKVGKLKRDKNGKPVWLYHPKFTNMDAETIYNLLPDPPEQGGAGGIADPELGDIYDPSRSICDVLDACDQMDEAAVNRIEAEHRVRMQQARSVMERRPGKMSADFVREMGELLEPVIDWKAIIQRFLNQMSRDDYSWMRPNRRYLSLGFTLPSLHSEIVRHLVFIVDTSGSIDNAALQRVGTEVNDAWEMGRIDKITVVYADARVKSHEVFEKGMDFKLRPAGGGGTNFADSMRFLREKCPDATAAIYFTDMYVSDFGKAPDCPMLWAIMGDKRQYKELAKKPPFGECMPCYE